MDAPHRLTHDERLYELIPAPVDAFGVREVAADQWESRYRTTLGGWEYEWSDDRDGQCEVLHRVTRAGDQAPGLP